MTTIDHAWLLAALILPVVFGYTWAPRTWVSGELVTAAMMNGLRDLFNAIRDFFFPTQSFRGLKLRTHPDADLAPSQVYLDHADEIVMHDGERSADWNDLSVDITASGAGGLDTGAEAASTWYEILAIQKSSDGTKGLLLHRAKDYFLDEQQTTSDAELELREGATTNVKIAQTFDTDEAGLLEFVDLQINKQGSPTGYMWVEVFATAAGAPTGAVLATSDKLNVALVSATDQSVRFAFRTPLTLVPGTTYAIALAGDYTASATVNIRVNYNTAGGYAAGEAYTFDGTTWTAVSGDDLWFKVYVTRNDTAVSMPADYDQRALIGWVYNDASSNLWPFAALNRAVRLRPTNFATGAGATIALTDLNASVPPVPTMMSVRASQTDAAGFPTLMSLPDGYGGTGTGVLITQGGSGVANAFLFVGDVAVEYQAVYLMVTGAGTGSFAITGFTW